MIRGLGPRGDGLAGALALCAVAGVLGMGAFGMGAGAGAQGSRPAGYLPSSALPESWKTDPQPPAPGSAALARDEAGASAALALRGSPRWDMAQRDAELRADAISAFSCAAGMPLGPQTTPRVDALLRRVLFDLALAVYPAKRAHQRARPFMVNGQPICTPQAEAGLRKDGSYPSGHSAIGYGWSLVLADLMPARASRIKARGRAFGDSRRVCNVHWLSDIEEGQRIAAATVARVKRVPEFAADFAAARKELGAVKASPPPAAPPLPAACAAEAAALR